jgi:hypothetical protein
MQKNLITLFDITIFSNILFIQQSRIETLKLWHFLIRTHYKTGLFILIAEKLSLIWWGYGSQLLKNKAKEVANQPRYTEPVCVAKTTTTKKEAHKNILKVSYFNVSKCK